MIGLSSDSKFTKFTKKIVIGILFLYKHMRKIELTFLFTYNTSLVIITGIKMKLGILVYHDIARYVFIMKVLFWDHSLKKYYG